MKRPFAPRKLLLPLVPAYRLALLVRGLLLQSGLRPVCRLRWPVVSIGNLSTGGAGKTPLAIALARLLSQHGLRVDVLSKGYGRVSRLAVPVNPGGSAEEFGDEPLLMARETGLPVYVAPQRYDAGLLAEADNSAGLPFGVHLLDDGFQHRQLFRDVDILLVNLADWQDGLLPAGNLREPLSAIRRATVLAIPADEARLEAELRAWGWQGPVWRLRRSMEVPPMDGIVVAFCGIARPEQFFAGLEAAGLVLTSRIVFRDHHRYTVRDVEKLVASAHAAGAAAFITTEKDFVRLGKLAVAFPESLPLKTARLLVSIEREDQAIDWLTARIASAPAHPPL